MKRLTYTYLKNGWKSFVNSLSYRQKIVLTSLCGIAFGLVSFVHVSSSNANLHRWR